MFSENYSLRYLDVPDSVVQLSRFSLANTLNLETVNIRDESHIRRLGMQVFANSGLTEFRIPASVSTVAQYAFEGCKRLRKIVFAGGSDIESISAYFFNGCTSIEEIAFEYGSRIKSIQAHGFNGLTNLRRIDFGGASIENIDNYAFRNCPSLAEIELPETLTNIGRFAFYRCASLRELRIPKAIEHIGEYAFLGTDKLELFFESETLPIYLEDNWDAGISGYYTGVTKTLTDGDWEYAVLSDGSVAILKYSGSEKHIDLTSFAHGSVKVIGGYAFAYTEIESVVLPASLEQIQRYAFAECGSLGSLTVPSNVTFIGQYAFYRTGIQSLEFESGTCIKVIEQYAFSGDRNLKTVVIPGSIEKLGQGVFYQSGLESVTFASGFSATTIPENAFAETKLRSVRIPDSVTLLDHNAFSHNLELKTVEFGNSDDLMIMSNVFYYTGLTSVKIGKNVSFIGEYAFMDLENLTAFEVDPENPYYSVKEGVLYNKDGTKLIAVPAGKTGSFTISKDIEIIGFGAFESSKLSEITFEDGSSLVTLGYRAFYGAKNLTSITVPKSVVSIDYYAFAECDKLKTVLFEEGNRLSGIYEGAFFGCRSLENILLPDAVVEISPYAFYACESLDKLPLSDNTSVLYIGDYAFAYTGISELDLPGQLYDIGEFAFRGIQIKELNIKPDDVRIFEIGIGAFADCDRLESVTLPFTGESIEVGPNDNFGYIFGSDYGHYDPEFVPESVTHITITEQKIFNVVDEDDKVWYSFYRLPNVETVVLPEDTYFIGPETFSYFSSLREFDLPYLLTSIERFTFDSCFSLKEIYLPDGIEYIGTEAFAYCRSLETVKLNDGLKVIMDGGIEGQFRQCAFSEIYLPDSLTYIGGRSFMECSNLKSIDIPANADVGETQEMFMNCKSLERVTIRCDEIGERMFSSCRELSTVELIGDIKRIGKDAFHDCELLSEISIPEHVEFIGDGAFAGCKSLKIDLELPESLTKVERYAFDGSGITSLVWPSSLTEVGDDAFRFCDNLRSIEIKAPLKVFPNLFFNWLDNSAIESVVMPDTIEEIASGALSSFIKLKSIKLPSSLKIIGQGAFSECTGLKEIELPESLKIIEDGAFGSGSIRTIINHSDLQIGFKKWDDSESNFGGIGVNATLIVDKYGEHYPEDDIVYLRTPEGLLFRDDDLWGKYTFVSYHGDAEVINIPSEINGKPVAVEVENIDGNGKKLVIPEGFEEARICASVGELVLPGTLRSIEFDMKNIVINRITVSSGNEHMRSENGLLIADGKVIFCTASAGDQIVVPDGVKEIGGYTFYKRNIKSVFLPDSLVRIEEFAFCKCRDLTEITLTDGFKEIMANAFQDCASLARISFGGCEYIGKDSFERCALENIVIPGSVKKIDAGAFGDNRRAREIILEEGVESIGDTAFENCDVINVSLPNSLKSIGRGAFNCWEDLDTIHIPAGVESIGDGAFWTISNVVLDEKNTHFTMYDGILYTSDGTSVVWTDRTKSEYRLLPTLTEISANMFATNLEVKSIVIPEGVTKICHGAFQCCYNLESITIPETLECIETYAFDLSAIKDIYIPASVKTIEMTSFIGTSCSLHVSPDNPYFFMRDGVLYGYADDGIHAMQGTKDMPDTVIIPDGVTVIDDSAFCNSSIKKVVFPDTLVRIWDRAFSNSQLEEIVWSNSVNTIWSNAFSGTNLKELIFPESVEHSFWYVDNLPELEKVYIPSGINTMYTSFRGCPKLQEIIVSADNDTFLAEDNIVYRKDTGEIVFPARQFNGTVRIRDGVTKIGEGTFRECTGMFELIIPNSVTVIAAEAFANTDLTKVYIPSSVSRIDNSAFSECERIRIVQNDSVLDFTPGCSMFPTSVIVFNRGELNEAVVDDWRYYLSGDYVCSEYVGDGEVDHRYRLNAYLGDLEDLTIPTILDGHDAVPYEFEPFHATTVRIAEGVTTITGNAFFGSKSLRRVVLPDTVREFELGSHLVKYSTYEGYESTWPFDNSSLREVNVPNGILSIDGWFGKCGELTTVHLPDGLISIGICAFQGCSSLKSIDLPDSLRTIEKCAFQLSGLESIKLPPNLETIEDQAFMWPPLTSITIPESVNYIGSQAFEYTKISEISLPDKELYLGSDVFGRLGWSTYASDENHWDGDFLYAGNHLLMYRGNDPYVCVDRNVKSIAASAFTGCSRVRWLEISGYAAGSLQPQYLTNLETLIIRRESTKPIREYFTDWPSTSYPDTLKSIVIKKECHIEHQDELYGINDVYIFVEGTKAEAPFDRIAPGWNNGNIVTYGDKWYAAKFYDQQGNIISFECFRNSQAIRPPYVVLPKSGDTAYKHIGWDLDGDGEPDGMPASRLSDVEAYAVVETFKPAYYTVKFMDLDRKTVIQEYTLEYGKTITPLETVPERTGYVFAGWENFAEGDKISENTKIYSVWNHLGGGHDYAATVVPPTCTEKGYTLHRCSICGDELRSDYVDATWHSFGEWIVDKPSSCSVHGEQHRVCSKCGFVENALLPTEGHTYDSTVIREATCTEFGIMKHVCSVCNDTMQETIALKPHEYCEVPADKEYIKWLDHEFSGIVWGCSEDKSNYWYYTCKHCGKIETVAVAEASSVGPNHRHEWSAILNDSGENVAVKCALCGEVECFKHDYEHTEENGIRKYTCKNCGDQYEEIVEYTVTFLDWDDRVISQLKYHYGDTVAVPQNPTRSSDNQHHYTFAGWDKEITPCYGDATYKATYSTEENLFTITFKNEDGSVIAVQVYHCGDKVTPPSDPVKQADNVYTYAFAGWTPEIQSVSGHAEYKAVYRSEYIDYTVKFIDWDGKVLSEKAYHYNDAVPAPENPVRAADDKYEYEFKGWNPAIASVTADAEYRAEYTEKAKTPAYKLGDVNGDGRVNAADYLLLKRIILRTAKATEEQSKRLDINGDGTVRANDYMLLKRIVLGTLAKP